jgi:hypothetical protein
MKAVSVRGIKEYNNTQFPSIFKKILNGYEGRISGLIRGFTKITSVEACRYF